MFSAVRTLPNVRLFVEIVLAAAVACCLFALPGGRAQAAELTESQITAIVNLLVSFDADQSIITNTEATLRGKATSATKPTHSEPIPSPATTTPVGKPESRTEEKPVPKPLIKVFNTTPSKVASGESVTLSWAAENTAQCGISPIKDGAPAVDLTKATSDTATGITSVVVGPLTQNAQYELRCAPLTGAKNENKYAVKRVEIKVTKPALPACKLQTDKESYRVGENAVISWTSKDATYGMFRTNTEDALVLPTEKVGASGTITALITNIGTRAVVLDVIGQNATSTCVRNIKIKSAVSDLVDAATLSANVLSAVAISPYQLAIDSLTDLFVYAGIGQ